MCLLILPHRRSTNRIDATPEYLKSREARDRIALAYPGKKVPMIVVLRDPIERARSHWRMAVDFVQRNLTDKTWAFDLAFNKTFPQSARESMASLKACRLKNAPSDFVDHCITSKNNMLGLGLYDMQINMYMETFPPSYFCVVASVS